MNRSELLCAAEGENTLRLGLTFVKGIDSRLGETLLWAREADEFRDLPDLLARSGLTRGALENLARSGALDSLDGVGDRRQALWQVGAGYVADVRRGQLALALPAATTPAVVSVQSRAERMLDEYSLLGLCPDGQVMELARPLLGPDVLNSDTVQGCRDGDLVRVAGRVVRRQRPLAKAVFLTLEDEWGLIPIAVCEGRWERLKHALRRPLVAIEGTVSRRDSTLNVMAERAWPLSLPFDVHRRRQDWR